MNVIKMMKFSDRLKTRLVAILKCAISSVFILMLIIATLSWVDSYTDEAYNLINHHIYIQSNMHWTATTKKIQMEKVIQLVCLPIPCSLIFVIYEFLIEVYDLIADYVKNVDRKDDEQDSVKGNCKVNQLKNDLMKLFVTYDEDNNIEKSQDFVNELRMNHIDNILEKLSTVDMKEEYLKNLISYNKYVIECNRHCQYIEEASNL